MTYLSMTLTWDWKLSIRKFELQMPTFIRELILTSLVYAAFRVQVVQKRLELIKKAILFVYLCLCIQLLMKRMAIRWNSIVDGTHTAS